MSYNIHRNKKIVYLSVIVLFLFFNLFILNYNLNQGSKNNDFSNDNDQKHNNKPPYVDNLKTQTLSNDNIFSGIGSSWNVTHWADRTDYDLTTSFINGSNGIIQIPLSSGWEGYELDANIKDLYDTRNWCNGTFNFGNDDGSDTPTDNDTTFISNSFQNWTFHDNDITTIATNAMSGSYIYSGGRDYLELYMRNGSEFIAGQWWWSYDPGDKCMWNTTFHVERGSVIDATLRFDINPNSIVDLNVFALSVYINNVKIYSIGTYDIETDFGQGFWGSYTVPMIKWANTSNVFSGNLNDTDVSISIALESLGANMRGFANRDFQEVFIDNVELNLTSEVKPDLIGLKLNSTDVNTVDWGEGNIVLTPSTNNWQSVGGLAHVNLSSTDTGVLGSYSIELDMDSTFYATKSGLDTTYESVETSKGTSYSVANDSSVNWVWYGFIQVPTGYVHQNLTISFPQDFNITGVYDPQFPTTNIIASCDTTTRGILLIPVKDISATPDGFWKIEAASPNYCEDVNLFVDYAGSWVKNDTVYSGETINIGANISSANLYEDISSYIDQTYAHLQLRFPNGTIWTDKTEIKQCDDTGFVNFTKFQIPNSNSPDYLPGEYQIIITWNNSYSSFGLNESGIIYKKFTVIHNSVLAADQDQYFFDDVLENSTINLKVNFTDLVDDTPISSADVYTYGLPYPSGTKLDFSEISSGFYFLEYNVTGGGLGNNSITIYANSSSFENKKINVTIDVLREVSFAINSTILSVSWNQNFSIGFNYTEKFSGTGIDAPVINDWGGEANVIQPSQGNYVITCNTSAQQVNRLYSLNLDIGKDGYQSYSIEITIEIKERETILNEIRLNESLTTSIVYPYGELLNISVKYTDVLWGQLIDTNKVQLKKGASVLGDFSKHPVLLYYNVTINSSQLDMGVNALSIYANKTNYFSALTSIIITVSERDTYLEIKLNDTLSTTFEYYNLTIGETLNITVWYRDSVSAGDPNIYPAIIQLTGVGAPRDIDKHPSLNQYNITLSADEFGQGVKFLTITANKVNYSLVSEVIKISVSERKTNLNLYVNGSILYEGDKYVAKLGVFINITITFIDNETASHLDGASVSLIGVDLLTEQPILNQYNINISSNDLGQGVNLYTIIAQKANYQTQTINFFLEVNETKTELQLFLDQQNKTMEEIIEVTIGDIVNVTITYKDDSNTHISNATVQISGAGLPLSSLTENNTLEHYYIFVDTNNLGQGTNILTITTVKTNYEQQTINVKIIIKGKITNYDIYLAQQNKTVEKFYEVSFGSTLNVTFLYYDNETGAHLSGALVQLLEEDVIIGNFTEIGQKYTLILYASDLSQIGQKFLRIFAQKTNYKSQNPKISINVKPIKCEVTTEDEDDTIKAKVDGSVKIKLILLNLDFGGKLITNATIKYSWELGDGYIEDKDNDGIYELKLDELPKGTYTITITVDAGKNYEFERYEITLNVVEPKEDVLLFQILIIVAVSAAIGLSFYFYAYQKVLKYPKPVRKVRKYRSKLKKKKELSIEITSREDAFNDLFEGHLGKLAKSRKHIEASKEDKVKSEVIDQYRKVQGGEAPK